MERNLTPRMGAEVDQEGPAIMVLVFLEPPGVMVPEQVEQGLLMQLVHLQLAVAA